MSLLEPQAQDDGLPAALLNDASPPFRNCDCGSGLLSGFIHDGNGIPLCRACPKCVGEKLKHYRPEILRPYTQADVDEPIEED